MLDQTGEKLIPIIESPKVNNNSRSPSVGLQTKYTIPKHPVARREHASKPNWSDWERNYNNDLEMSTKSIWETHFRNEREHFRFSTEINEMQSQRKILRCKTKKELDKVKEEYVRMMALSCVYKNYQFSKFDPLREEREKLTKKNLEMFEESYKAHIRCRSRSESPRSEQSIGRQRSFYRSQSPQQVRQRPSYQREATRPRSSSPSDKTSGIKGFNKLFPAIVKKKQTGDRKTTLAVKGSSVKSQKNPIRPQSDIPISEKSQREKEPPEGPKPPQKSQQTSQQTAQQTKHQSKSTVKQGLWKNPLDEAQKELRETGNPVNTETRVLDPNSATAKMFGAYKTKFENRRQAHSEPPMRLRFMMQLREASANLEPIPERPKSFLPDEMRCSVKASRQFMHKEVKKVLHAWSPSTRRRVATKALLEEAPRPIMVDRGKTLSAIMRDFRVYMEETQPEGRFPPIYKERYIFPELG